MEKNLMNFSDNKIENEKPTSYIIQADAILFKNDVKSICNQLDVLFSIAIKAKTKNEESDIFAIKIRSGIMRLKKLEAFDEASFYETELATLTTADVVKKKEERNYFLISIIGLTLIACFGNKILQESFSLYQKVIDTLIHYFK